MKKIISIALVVLMAMFAVSFTTSNKIANAVKENGNSAEITVWGDADLDGRVTIRDAATIQKHLVGYISLNSEQLRLSDTDANGTVNIGDTTVIQKYLVDLIDIMPIEEQNKPSENTNPTHDTNLNDSSVPSESSNPTDNTKPSDSTVPSESTTSSEETTPNETEYSESKVYNVVFYDSDGKTVLKTQTVENGKAAFPPEAPQKTGVEFIGWSGNYCNVTDNESVKAVYNDEKNVFVAKPSAISSSNTVDVLLSLDGAVKTCGFDLNVMYDSNLELTNYDDDLDLELVTNANAYKNGIRLNFSAVNDKVKQRDIIKLTFRIKDASKKSLPVTITMNSIKEIYNNNPINSTYTIVNAVVNE